MADNAAEGMRAAKRKASKYGMNASITITGIGIRPFSLQPPFYALAHLAGIAIGAMVIVMWTAELSQ